MAKEVKLLRVRIIGGPWPDAIGKQGIVIKYSPSTGPGLKSHSVYWVEFEDVTFEGADPKTQHANRSYFFANEVKVLND